QQMTACGSATASCTQTIDAHGTVLYTNCTCTASGFRNPIGPIMCDEWLSFFPAPSYSMCLNNCGSTGYIDGSHFPCQLRQFWTPPYPIPGAPTFSTATPLYSTEQLQQIWWLANPIVVGLQTLPAMVGWFPRAMNWTDNLATVQSYWSWSGAATNARPLQLVQCTCDSTPFAAAAVAVNQLQPNAIPNFDVYLSSKSAGLGIDYQTLQLNNNYTFTLQLDQLDFTFLMYPATAPAMASTFGNFYQMTSCKGPYTLAINKLFTNPAIGTPEPGSGTPLIPAAHVIQIQRLGSTSSFLLTTDAAPSQIPFCTLISPWSGTQVPSSGVILQVYAPYPNSYWIIVIQITQSSPPQESDTVTFTCPATGSFATSVNLLYPSGQMYPMDPVTDSGVPTYYIDASALYSIAPAYSQVVCNNQVVPSVNPSTMNGIPPSYLLQTLQTSLSFFTIVQSNGNVPSDNPTGWGPLVLNNIISTSCACRPGWGGAGCAVTLACAPEPIPPEHAPCASIAGFDPNVPRYKIVYEYDFWFNFYLQPHPVLRLNASNCPYQGSQSCNLDIYYSVAQQFCAHGTFDPITQYCTCQIGWTFTGGPTDIGNGCSRPNPFNCRQLSTTQACNGNGFIDSNGNCQCNAGWRTGTDGYCCTTPNLCPDCSKVEDTHILACNHTATGAVNICQPGATGGIWTGICCNSFQFFGSCRQNGGYANPSGELVFTY